jgi:hypothetical protein
MLQALVNVDHSQELAVLIALIGDTRERLPLDAVEVILHHQVADRDGCGWQLIAFEGLKVFRVALGIKPLRRDQGDEKAKYEPLEAVERWRFWRPPESD